MTARYTIFGSPDLGGYAVLDTRTGDPVLTLEMGRPMMPLSQASLYTEKADALRAAMRLNAAYDEAMRDD
jgi:hypothetical protein